MRSFAKNIFRVQTLSCDLTPLTVVTTDPTNQAGNNGTAIITYSGNQGLISYSINNSSFISVNTSPFTITGLEASTQYTVIVKDDVEVNCQKSIVFNLGESSFEFEASYIMLTYEFTDGLDLDTRTRIVTPDVGQDTQVEYMGWNRLQSYPTSLTPPNIAYEIFGGDNQGTGFESVLFNISEFRRVNPLATTLVIDARAFWYTTVGNAPVKVAATLWKNGTPIKNGCQGANNSNFCWTNPTADTSFQIDSVGKIITLQTTDASSSGQRVATLTYDLITNVGVLDNNDTTTPSV